MSGSHFSLANIPFGIGSSTAHKSKSPVTRLEDTVIFLDELVNYGLLSSLPSEATDSFFQVGLHLELGESAIFD